MKKIRFFLFALLSTICLMSLVGCNTHIHNYQYFVIGEPTCNEDGKLEGICSCGEKITQTVSASHKRDEFGVCSVCGDVVDTPNHKHNWVWSNIVKPTCTTGGLSSGSCNCGATTTKTENALGHNRVDGMCTVCGDGASVIPEGQSIGYTIENIFNKVKELGFIPVTGYDLNGWSLSDIKIDKLNFVHVSVSDTSGLDYNIPLGNQKINFNILTPANLQFVSRISISYGKLNVVFADGTSIDYGYIEGIYNYETNEAKVKSVFINNNDLLLVAYTDNTVKVAGKIAKVNDEIGGGQLIYSKIPNKEEYAVIGLFNKEVTKVVIPDTHRGLPVTEIEEYAFSDNLTITEVIFGANVKSVRLYAFAYCSKLNKLTLNNNLINIESRAFYGCPIENVVIPSTVYEIGTFAFYNNSIEPNIYLNVAEIPDAWSKRCFESCKVYLLGEWEYVNGVPTPKK